MNKPYYVHAWWDEEAKVWAVSSDDVPGLATEADTTESPIQKLKTLIPKLLEANGQSPSKPITFELLTRGLNSRPEGKLDQRKGSRYLFSKNSPR